MILALELRSAARCKSCSVLTPLPGLRNNISCRNCAATIDFRARADDSRRGGLRYPFGGYYDALAEAAILLAEGADCRDARDSQGSSVALRRAVPLCLVCDAPLPFPADGASDVACPRCAEPIAVRWPDAETRAWDPRMYCVIGDGQGRGAVARETSGEGALIKCGHCGAPMSEHSPGDRRRSRACTHCGGLNYLSDAAWLALYPQPEWHRCYLVYALDARDFVALHEWLAEQEAKYWLDAAAESARALAHIEARRAARPAISAAILDGSARPAEISTFASDAALTDAEAAAIDARLDDAERLRLAPDAARALVVRFARASSAGVRRLVAAHPASDAALLDALAGDVDASVRAGVAARPQASADTLARLRKDPDATVVEKVKLNPSYRPGFLEKLFG